MPLFRLTEPDGHPVVVEADELRVETAHQVLYGTALVMNRPRTVVVRRVPLDVLVQQLDDA